jgi:hypothetical protein
VKMAPNGAIFSYLPQRQVKQHAPAAKSPSYCLIRRVDTVHGRG